MVAGAVAGAGGALAAGAGSISIFTGGGGGWGGSWVSCVSIWLLGARFAVGWFSGLRGARVLRAGFSSLASFTEALTKPLRGSEGKLARFLTLSSAKHWLLASVLPHASSNKKLGFSLQTKRGLRGS